MRNKLNRLLRILRREKLREDLTMKCEFCHGEIEEKYKGLLVHPRCYRQYLFKLNITKDPLEHFDDDNDFERRMRS